jgi:hypothetical protein
MAECGAPNRKWSRGVHQHGGEAVLVDEGGGEPQRQLELAYRDAEIRCDGFDGHRRFQKSGRPEYVFDEPSVVCYVLKCHKTLLLARELATIYLRVSDVMTVFAAHSDRRFSGGGKRDCTGDARKAAWRLRGAG